LDGARNIPRRHSVTLGIVDDSWLSRDWLDPAIGSRAMGAVHRWSGLWINRRMRLCETAGTSERHGGKGSNVWAYKSICQHGSWNGWSSGPWWCALTHSYNDAV